MVSPWQPRPLRPVSLGEPRSAAQVLDWGSIPVEHQAVSFGFGESITMLLSILVLRDQAGARPYRAHWQELTDGRMAGTLEAAGNGAVVEWQPASAGGHVRWTTVTGDDTPRWMLDPLAESIRSALRHVVPGLRFGGGNAFEGLVAELGGISGTLAETSDGKPVLPVVGEMITPLGLELPIPTTAVAEVVAEALARARYRPDWSRPDRGTVYASRSVSDEFGHHELELTLRWSGDAERSEVAWAVTAPAEHRQFFSEALQLALYLWRVSQGDEAHRSDRDAVVLGPDAAAGPGTSARLDFRECESEEQAQDLVTAGWIPLGRWAFGPDPGRVRLGDVLTVPPQLLTRGAVLCAPPGQGKTRLLVRWAAAARDAGFSVLLVDVKGTLAEEFAKQLDIGQPDVACFTTEPRASERRGPAVWRRLDLTRGLWWQNPDAPFGAELAAAVARHLDATNIRIEDLAETLMSAEGIGDSEAQDFHRNRTRWLRALIRLQVLHHAYCPERYAHRMPDLTDLRATIASYRSFRQVLGDVRSSWQRYEQARSGPWREIENGAHLRSTVDRLPGRWLQEVEDDLSLLIAPEDGGVSTTREPFSLLTERIRSALDPFAGPLREAVSSSGPGEPIDLEKLVLGSEPTTVVLAARERDRGAKQLLAAVVRRVGSLVAERFGSADVHRPPLLLLLDEAARIPALDPNAYAAFCRQADAGAVFVYQDLRQIGPPDSAAQLLDAVGLHLHLGSVPPNTLTQLKQTLGVVRRRVPQQRTSGPGGTSVTEVDRWETRHRLEEAELQQLGHAGSRPALAVLNPIPPLNRKRLLLLNVDDLALPGYIDPQRRARAALARAAADEVPAGIEHLVVAARHHRRLHVVGSAGDAAHLAERLTDRIVVSYLAGIGRLRPVWRAMAESLVAQLSPLVEPIPVISESVGRIASLWKEAERLNRPVTLLVAGIGAGYELNRELARLLTAIGHDGPGRVVVFTKELPGHRLSLDHPLRHFQRSSGPGWDLASPSAPIATVSYTRRFEIGKVPDQGSLGLVSDAEEPKTPVHDEAPAAHVSIREGWPPGPFVTRTPPDRVWTVSLSADGSRALAGGYWTSRAGAVILEWPLRQPGAIRERLLAAPNRAWWPGVSTDGSRVWLASPERLVGIDLDAADELIEDMTGDTAPTIDCDYGIPDGVVPAQLQAELRLRQDKLSSLAGGWRHLETTAGWGPTIDQLQYRFSVYGPAVSDDGEVLAWSLDLSGFYYTGEHFGFIERRDGHQSLLPAESLGVTPKRVVISNDGQRVAFWNDNNRSDRVVVWDLVRQAVVGSLVCSVPEDYLHFEDFDLQTVDPEDESEEAGLDWDAVTGVALDGTGRRILTGGTVATLWDLEAAPRARFLGDANGPVALTRSGDYAAVACGDDVHLYRTDTGAFVGWLALGSSVQHIALEEVDGGVRVIAATHDGDVVLFEVNLR